MVGEHNLLWNHEPKEASAQIVLQHFRIYRGARGGHNNSGHPLPEHRIGNAENDRLLDAWMLTEGFLDGARIDLFAPPVYPIVNTSG